MTDIEIAQKNVMEPIVNIAKKIDISSKNLELYGNYKAKISFNELKILQEKAEKNPGKLILVTAITPTAAGEGKSTVSIGLSDGLNKIGKKTVVSYILTNLVEEKELGDTAENRIYNQIKRYLISNPESVKSQFIELVVQKTDYDDAIKYLMKIYPLLRKRKLSDEEVEFLKPFDDIRIMLDKIGD